MRLFLGLSLLVAMGCGGGGGSSTLPVELDVAITSHQSGDYVADVITLTGTCEGGEVEVAVDAGPFLPADGDTSWSIAIDTSDWDLGYHIVQARVRNGSEQALARVSLYSENQYVPPPPPPWVPPRDPLPDPPEDTLAHWGLANRAGSDSSSSGLHGTVYGSPEITGEGFLVFDGIDDYVGIPDGDGPAPTVISNLSEGTIAVRFRVDSIMNGKTQAGMLPLLWFGANESRSYMETDGVAVYIGHGQLNNPNFRQVYFTVLEDGMVKLCFDTGVSVQIGEWHDYVVVITNNSHAAYLDGVEMQLIYNAGSSPASDGFFSTVKTPDLMTIGYGKDQISDSWFYFPGGIDDVRIYDRALSSTEVAALYSRP